MAIGRKREQDSGPGTEIARPDRVSNAVNTAVPDDDVAVIPDHVLEKIIAEVERLPESDDDGQWGIVEQLLTATDMDDLNRPWEATSGKTLAGRRLQITSVKRRPSSFEGGPEIFLVIDSVDLADGEKLVWTSSALAVIIQLAVAYNRGWLPLIAEVTAARKPTKRGYIPYHLTITRIKADR